MSSRVCRRQSHAICSFFGVRRKPVVIRLGNLSVVGNVLRGDTNVGRGGALEGLCEFACVESCPGVVANRTPDRVYSTVVSPLHELKENNIGIHAPVAGHKRPRRPNRPANCLQIVRRGGIAGLERLAIIIADDKFSSRRFVIYEVYPSRHWRCFRRRMAGESSHQIWRSPKAL